MSRNKEPISHPLQERDGANKKWLRYERNGPELPNDRLERKVPRQELTNKTELNAVLLTEGDRDKDRYDMRTCARHLWPLLPQGMMPSLAALRIRYRGSLPLPKWYNVEEETLMGSAEDRLLEARN